MIKRFTYCMWLVVVDIWLTIVNACTKDKMIEAATVIAMAIGAGILIVAPIFLLEWGIQTYLPENAWVRKDHFAGTMFYLIGLVILWFIEYLIYLFFRAANKKCKELNNA